MWQKEQTLNSYQVVSQERVSVNMKISLVLVCFHSGWGFLPRDCWAEETV